MDGQKYQLNYEMGKKNISRRLAYLIDHKYGQIVQAPYILVK